MGQQDDITFILTHYTRFEELISFDIEYISSFGKVIDIFGVLWVLGLYYKL